MSKVTQSLKSLYESLNSNYTPSDVEQIIPPAIMGAARALAKRSQDDQAIEYIRDYFLQCADHSNKPAQPIQQKMIQQVVAYNRFPAEFKDAFLEKF